MPSPASRPPRATAGIKTWTIERPGRDSAATRANVADAHGASNDFAQHPDEPDRHSATAGVSSSAQAPPLPLLKFPLPREQAGRARFLAAPGIIGLESLAEPDDLGKGQCTGPRGTKRARP